MYAYIPFTETLKSGQHSLDMLVVAMVCDS